MILSEFAPNIILNMTASDGDIKLGYRLQAIIEKYLSIKAVFLGQVEEDPAIRISAKKMIPFSVFAPDCKAVKNIKHIVQSLLNVSPGVLKREAGQAEFELKR
jgi:MinD-like ATPase involved in chromosome partitioning or flagellar assembly